MRCVKTKYKTIFELTDYRDQLVNDIFKLLPLRENNEEWQKYLKALLVELHGLHSNINNITLLKVINKLEGLLTQDVEFTIYRKIILDIIPLFKTIGDANDNME